MSQGFLHVNRIAILNMMRFGLYLLVYCFFVNNAYAEVVDSDEIVAAHNRWRVQVGVAKLSYSTDLAVSAQAWADTLKKTNACHMRHSKPEGKYGENIFWASAIAWTDGRRELQKVSSAHPVDSWGSEKLDYDYATNNCKPGKMCGHYTQMVWNSTRKVGCAVAVCEDSQEQVWVCQYQPAGNRVGVKPY